jgi:hypothetical protein
MYNRLWSRYEVDEEDQYDIDNPHLGYYPITDPRHVDYIPEPEEFLARGVHHITTLQGPQAQLSPTHLILPTIEQAAGQGEEIPVDIEPIASTSAVIIQPTMAQQGGAQIQGNIFR